MPNKDKLKAFWAATDITSMAAVVDLEASVTEWAAEALLNDGRRVLGRRPQLLPLRLSRQGLPLADRRRGRDLRLARPKRRPPDLLVDGPLRRRERGAALPDRHRRSDLAGGATSRRSGRSSGAGTSRACRAGSTRGRRRSPMRWSRIRTGASAWRITTRTIAEMRQVVVDRAAYLTTFLACQDGSGDASDADGDGFAWCNDCNDVHRRHQPGRRRALRQPHRRQLQLPGRRRRSLPVICSDHAAAPSWLKRSEHRNCLPSPREAGRG